MYPDYVINQSLRNIFKRSGSGLWDLQRQINRLGTDKSVLVMPLMVKVFYTATQKPDESHVTPQQLITM